MVGSVDSVRRNGKKRGRRRKEGAGSFVLGSLTVQDVSWVGAEANDSSAAAADDVGSATSEKHTDCTVRNAATQLQRVSEKLEFPLSTLSGRHARTVWIRNF